MRFEPNKPFATTRPTVVVDAGLPVGNHRFRLVVVNARGKESPPVDVIVSVGSFPRPPVIRPPTPIVSPTRPPIR